VTASEIVWKIHVNVNMNPKDRDEQGVPIIRNNKPMLLMDMGFSTRVSKGALRILLFFGKELLLF
jgi:hypothetical protein